MLKGERAAKQVQEITSPAMVCNLQRFGEYYLPNLCFIYVHSLCTV
jgi:hypothetical protein